MLPVTKALNLVDRNERHLAEFGNNDSKINLIKDLRAYYDECTNTRLGLRVAKELIEWAMDQNFKLRGLRAAQANYEVSDHIRKQERADFT